MSEHKIAKIRECKKCGARDKLTAKELKEHAASCTGKIKRVA